MQTKSKKEQLSEELVKLSVSQPSNYAEASKSIRAELAAIEQEERANHLQERTAHILKLLKARDAVPIAEIAGSFPCPVIEAHGFCSDLERQGLVALASWVQGDWQTSEFKITEAGLKQLEPKPEAPATEQQQ